MIVRFHLDEDGELAQHLTNELNAPLDWPEGGELDTGLVAKIAAAAASDVSYDQAANGHLVDLFAELPLPGTTRGREFWSSMYRAAGDAALYIDPGNAGGPFIDYLIKGNEAGIAGRVLSFLAELDDGERDVVAELIGGELDVLGDAKYYGNLWLRDAETTAWHVELASRRRHKTAEDRERFLQAWRDA
ncbi:hypothetical protein CP981_16635 [Streptomyces platensis]|uniref:Uncharacterized protein n=1 Tax=Streptomyces platensis TaxID=58346 RepID=A0AAE6NJQ1_STRPT|nr:hypothetical protein [Streptomyces platensis]OSY44483.1 hypothetical protein BG653_04086 [Streptomyces platensis]QEV53075.1 hypothetical protein CP981_16635 [Streptomyces platensis]